MLKSAPESNLEVYTTSLTALQQLHNAWHANTRKTVDRIPSIKHTNINDPCKISHVANAENEALHSVVKKTRRESIGITLPMTAFPKLFKSRTQIFWETSI